MNSKKRKKLLLLLFISCFVLHPAFGQSPNYNWQEVVSKQLKLLGHRNWILVVDAAYPYQSNPAIKTIDTGAAHLEVVREVLNRINKAPHIFPEVYLDKELDYVPENEAAGIEVYRKELQKLLKQEKVDKVLHEEMIMRIDKAAETFHILVLKTNFTLPYTSVFFNLNCGYWTPDQENKLRKLMPD